MALAKATAKKAVHIPNEGEYLTDGRRLVEVIGKERKGIKVLDANVPVKVGLRERDPRATEVLTVEDATTKWRIVQPCDDPDEAA